jgi:hypothetical protein
MIQYKQKQQMNVIKQLMPVQKLHTPCQVKKKKRVFNTHKKNITLI